MNDAQRTALRAAMQFNYPSFPCNAHETPAVLTDSKMRHCLKWASRRSGLAIRAS
jgi:hypothetical protein